MRAVWRYRIHRRRLWGFEWVELLLDIGGSAKDAEGAEERGERREGW